MSGSRVSLSSELQPPHMASPLGGPGLQTSRQACLGLPLLWLNPPLASSSVTLPLPRSTTLGGCKSGFLFQECPPNSLHYLCASPSSKRPCPQEALLDPCCPAGRRQPCRCFAPSPQGFSASAVVCVGGCARVRQSWPRLSETAFACSPVPTGWHTPGMTEAPVRVGRLSERVLRTCRTSETTGNSGGRAVGKARSEGDTGPAVVYFPADGVAASSRHVIRRA